MGHTYNHGLVTSQKGAALEGFKCTFLSAAATLVDNGKSGILSTTITHTSTGLYTFQLVVPYPPKEIAIIPSLNCVSASGTILIARYVHGSYSNSTGQFQVAITNTSNSATDPTDNTALHMLIMFQRYTT